MNFFITLALILALCSCENKKSSDGKDHSIAQPAPPTSLPQNKTETPAQPDSPSAPEGPTRPLPIDAPSNSSGLPVLSFSNYSTTLNRKLEAQLELQLSHASDVPVVVEVVLVNGTAIHYRDYSGFKARSGETQQTIIFTPGTSRIRLPIIGGRHTEYCDSIFYVKINKSSLQKATVTDNIAQVLIPCHFDNDQADD